MNSVDITWGPISFDLTALVRFLWKVVNGDLDAETKKAIQEAIDEVLSGYGLTVDWVTPFLKVSGGSKFKEEFVDAYGKYIDVQAKFLKIKPSQLPACHKVYDMLDTVSKKGGIRARIPYFKRKINKMRKLADGWLLNDETAFQGLAKLHSYFLQDMRGIYWTLEERSIEEARKEFKLLIDQIMKHLNVIQIQLEKLESIKRKL